MSGEAAAAPRFSAHKDTPPRADRLQLDWWSDGNASGVTYRIDAEFSGRVGVDWSAWKWRPDITERAAINWSLGVLLAQFCLPRRLTWPVSPPPGGLEPLRAIAAMLWDVRAFCDETAFRPAMTLERAAAGAASPLLPSGLEPKRTLLMLSGGADSAMALLTLLEAGQEVDALYVDINTHAADTERRAARAVAAELGVTLHEVSVEFPESEAIGRYYSRSFGVYPFYNAVPHGRDFPLAVIGAVVARRIGAGNLVFGHEKESRGKKIVVDGQTIYRNDVESEVGRQWVLNYIHATVAPDLRLFSPLGGVSIYRIRRAMLLAYPGLAAEVRSCFWGEACGQCLKCVSHYALRRELGLPDDACMANPFADRNNADLALLADPDRPSEMLGYGPQIHYSMLRIVEQGLVRPEDHWLHVFRERGLPRVAAQRARIDEICLAIDAVAEMPDGLDGTIRKLYA